MWIAWMLLQPSADAGHPSSTECEAAAYLSTGGPRLIRCYPRGSDFEEAAWYPLFAGDQPKEELIDDRAPILVINEAFPMDRSVDLTDEHGTPLRVRLKVLPGNRRQGLCGDPPTPGSEHLAATLLVENLDRDWAAVVPALRLEGSSDGGRALPVLVYDEGKERYCDDSLTGGAFLNPEWSLSFRVDLNRPETDSSTRVSVIIGTSGDRRLDVAIPRSRAAG